MTLNASQNLSRDVAEAENVEVDNLTATTAFPLELPPDMVFGEAQVISISVYSVLFVASGVLNLNVLANLLRTKRHVGLTRLNNLLLQLVLADLLVTFLMMPLEIIWAATVSWWAGDALCRICSFFRIFGLFLSSNIVICISVDRFLAILKPFSVRSSSSRVRYMLTLAWGTAVVLSLPQAFVFKLQFHPQFPWYGQCVTYGSFSTRQAEFLYFMLGMVFMYILPLVVIAVTYGGIIVHLHRNKFATVMARAAAGPQNGIRASGHRIASMRNRLRRQSSLAATVQRHNSSARNGVGGSFRGHHSVVMTRCNSVATANTSCYGGSPCSNNGGGASAVQTPPSAAQSVANELDGEAFNGDRNGSSSSMRKSAPGMINKAKLNTIKITLTLVGAFLACWTPYYVMCMWYWLFPDSYANVDYRVRKFLYLFACTNSCVNPLIYGFFAGKSGGQANALNANATNNNAPNANAVLNGFSLREATSDHLNRRRSWITRDKMSTTRQQQQQQISLRPNGRSLPQISAHLINNNSSSHNFRPQPRMPVSASTSSRLGLPKIRRLLSLSSSDGGGGYVDKKKNNNNNNSVSDKADTEEVSAAAAAAAASQVAATLLAASLAAAAQQRAASRRRNPRSALTTGLPLASVSFLPRGHSASSSTPASPRRARAAAAMVVMGTNRGMKLTRSEEFNGKFV